jgi:TRAP transporter TAXI family solute receptor
MQQERLKTSIATTIAGIISFFCASFGTTSLAQDQTTVTIATGQFGGLYHLVGGAICHILNENRTKHGFTCTVDITSGSIDNIVLLRNGEAHLALVQSDWQHAAFKGVGPFETVGTFDGLRSVWAVYVEDFTIVARDETDVTTIEDLKGKRIYLGSQGSGQRQTMQVVMGILGWADDAITDFTEFKASNPAEALCDDEFDAIVYTIGNPNPTVQEAISTCRANLLSVTHPGLDRLAERRPFYVTSVIPGGTYPGHSADISTLGLVATLVTSSEVPSAIIYELTQGFFGNLEELKKSYPLIATLKPQQRASTGLTAPLHDGALKYFSELGLIKQGE